jgi:hypothetical protein
LYCVKQIKQNKNRISNNDPVWEAEYKRQFFDFSGIGEGHEGHFNKVEGDDDYTYSNIHDDDYE